MSQQMAVPSGLKTWSDLVFEEAIAKTKGAFDNVDGNAEEVTLQKKDAAAILGLMINYAQSVGTDAEGVPDLIVEINSKALGIQAQEYIVGNGCNDYDALTSHSKMRTRFIPFKAPAGKSLFNADMKFRVAPSVSTTGGVDVVIAVVYSNQLPDSAFQQELLSQMHGAFNGGVAQADPALAHATGGSAAAGTSMTLPTGANQLKGLFANILPNAIIVDQPISGFFELQATGITDFGPQLWLLPNFYNAVLGTVIDHVPQSSEARYYPTRFQLSGSRTVVKITTTLLTNATTAPNVSQGLIYDE